MHFLALSDKRQERGTFKCGVHWGPRDDIRWPSPLPGIDWVDMEGVASPRLSLFP